MDDDDADISAFRLRAKDSRTLTRKVEKRKKKDKKIMVKLRKEKKREKEKEKQLANGNDPAAAIAVPSSPPSSASSSSSSSPAPSVISIHSGASDDEFEEVPIPGVDGPLPAESWDPHSLDAVEGQVSYASYLTESEDEGIMITLDLGGQTEAEKAKALELALRKKPMTAKDRAIRMEIHKMHTICLLANARIRNRWASDDVLKARLLSLLPHHLHAAFSISPKRFPDRAQRSRLFHEALQNLASWWAHSFFDISDETLGQRTRTWDDIQEIIDRLPPVDKWELKKVPWTSRWVEVEGADADPKGKGKKKEGRNKKTERVDPVMKALTEEVGGERLRSVNSMMKRCLQQEGSRDVSAQLFVSLARACGLGARLVVSIQAVPFKAEKAVTKKKSGAGNGGRSIASRQGMGADGASEEDEMEEVPIPGVAPSPANKSKQRGGHLPKMDDPADIYRLRKQRPQGQTLGTAEKPKRRKKEVMTTQPPVFWTEVFSRSDQRWVPVDPVTGIVRKKAQYDPSSDTGPVRMVYVVAYEEDGFARDVTLRYAKNFGARTCKLRPPLKPGEENDWWSTIVQFLQRPQRLNRDDLEDAELEMSQVNESMPLVMTGFKDHPLYVLERHLKQNEVIQPKREIGRFKGEAVYRRNNVLQLKTAETWIRFGRMVKPRQEPLKWIKQRAVTIQKRRAQELALQEGQEPIQQGLYAEYQTELYKAPPIKDGIIPQNAFGNIDLYTPSMLPEGAVHLPYKGIAKVAKGLSVSYAEAVTSFEFKRFKATAVLTGIVVAKENEDVVLEAYWISAAAAEEKEKARRETQALKRWAKLITGIRVRNRLRETFGTGGNLQQTATNPMALEPTARSAASVIATASRENAARWKSAIVDRLEGESDEEDIKPVIDEIEGGAHAEAEAVMAAEEAEPEPAAEDMEEMEEMEGEGEPTEPEEKQPTRPPETPAPRLRIKLRFNTPQSVVPEAEATTTRSGRPRRGVANTNDAGVNGASTPTAAPPGPVPAPTPVKRVGRMKPAMKPKPQPAVLTSTPKAPAPSKKAAKPKNGKSNGRKRKASASGSEAEAEESDDTPAAAAPAPAPARGRKAAPAPPAPTRTLRSRGPKTAEQLAAEEEKRARMMEAMASDDDE